MKEHEKTPYEKPKYEEKPVEPTKLPEIYEVPLKEITPGYYKPKEEYKPTEEPKEEYEPNEEPKEEYKPESIEEYKPKEESKEEWKPEEPKAESKGQLISKCLFGTFNSPKREQKQFDITKGQ